MQSSISLDNDLSDDPPVSRRRRRVAALVGAAAGAVRQAGVPVADADQLLLGVRRVGVG